MNYPNWWGTIPMPVASFLENADLSGKYLGRGTGWWKVVGIISDTGTRDYGDENTI